MESKEGLGEAGGECSLGFRDAVFGAGHFGGVAGDEVEHCLLGGEFGDRGEDTAGVASEEDDVCGVVFREAGDLGVRDVFDWVGAVYIAKVSHSAVNRWDK